MATGVIHANAANNPTGDALDRNIEIRFLFRDRALAASVASHFRALIQRELLKPLPMG